LEIADGKQERVNINRARYFRTARSNDLQMSPASADGEQFVLMVFPRHRCHGTNALVIDWAPTQSPIPERWKRPAAVGSSFTATF